MTTTKRQGTKAKIAKARNCSNGRAGRSPSQNTPDTGVATRDAEHVATAVPAVLRVRTRPARAWLHQPKVHGGDFDQQALLERIDHDDHAAGAVGIVDHALQSPKRTAYHLHQLSLGKERAHRRLESRGCDTAHLLKLGEKRFFICDRNEPHQQVLLVAAGAGVFRHLSEYVSGKNRFGVHPDARSVAPLHFPQEQLVGETLGGKQSGEFLFTTGLRVRHVPTQIGRLSGRKSRGGGLHGRERKGRKRRF